MKRDFATGNRKRMIANAEGRVKASTVVGWGLSISFLAAVWYAVFVIGGA